MTIPVRIDITVAESEQQFDVTVSENSIPIQVEIDTQIVAGASEEYEGPYSVTPSEQAQTLETEGLVMTGDVAVSAIPGNYVGSSIPRRDSTDLDATGAIVSVPAGHYAEDASKSIQNATVSNSTNVTANPTLSVNYETGEISATVSKTQSVSVVTSAGYAPVTSHNVAISGNAATQLITHDSSDLTVSGPTVTAPDGYYPNSASKTVQSGSATTPTLGIEAIPNISITNSGKITSSVSKAESITPVVSEGYVTAGTAGTVTFAGSNTLQLNTKSGATITPTESQQVAVEQNRWTTGQVKVGAISNNYVGSGVARKTSSDLVVADDTVTAPAGYYENDASATVQSATWKSASTIGVVPSISVDANGLITATASGWTSCKPLSTSGYADADTSANLQLAGSKTSQLDTVGATTYTPNKVSAQEIPAGKYTTGIQTIGKIPDEYIVPSGTKSITSNGTGIDVTSYASVDVAVPSQSATLQSKSKTYTPTTSQQTDLIAPDTGYDGLDSVSITINAVATGTAGTPTATKGAVSNHSVSVTPSVTNTTGYITGSTKTGTAVTVSASELVSGSETKTANGTYDVTNLAELVVNVSGGGGSNWTLLGSKELTISTTSTSNTNQGDITCSGAFTKDDIIWVRVRDKAGKRAGHMYGTDTFFLNANKANGSTSTYSTKATEVIRYSTSSQWACYTGNYGVYGYSISSAGKILIYSRYNSTNTLTINGTYLIEVYKLTLPTGKTIFG